MGPLMCVLVLACVKRDEIENLVVAVYVRDDARASKGSCTPAAADRKVNSAVDRALRTARQTGR